MIFLSGISYEIWLLQTWNFEKQKYKKRRTEGKYKKDAEVLQLERNRFATPYPFLSFCFICLLICYLLIFFYLKLSSNILNNLLEKYSIDFLFQFEKIEIFIDVTFDISREMALPLPDLQSSQLSLKNASVKK